MTAGKTDVNISVAPPIEVCCLAQEVKDESKTHAQHHDGPWPIVAWPIMLRPPHSPRSAPRLACPLWWQSTPASAQAVTGQQRCSSLVTGALQARAIHFVVHWNAGRPHAQQGIPVSQLCSLLRPLLFVNAGLPHSVLVATTRTCLVCIWACRQGMSVAMCCAERVGDMVSEDDCLIKAAEATLRVCGRD
jgi:hypothetical protein